MRQLKGVLLAMISSSTFGLIPLFALPAMQEGVGLDSVLFYRFAISAVVVGVYLLLRRVDLRITLKEFGTMFLLGGAYASTSLFLTASYLYIPSGVATTIHFLYPMVVTTVMILFFKDKVSVPVIGATLMAILGVYLLSNNGTAGTVSLKGLLLVLTTVVTYALYIIGFDSDIGFRFYVNLIGTACRLDDYGCIGMYGTVDCRMYGCLVSARKPGLLAIGRDCDYFVGGIGCHSGQ